MGLVIIVFFIMAFQKYTQNRLHTLEYSPEKFTTPLKSSEIIYLCKILEIPKIDKRCQSKNTYSIEFFQEIQEQYSNQNREMVDAELGRYRITCGEVVALSGRDSFIDVFQVCIYDLNGDRVYTIEISYYLNSLERLPEDNFNGYVGRIALNAKGEILTFHK